MGEGRGEGEEGEVTQEGRGESPGFAAAWGESGAGVCYTG